MSVLDLGEGGRHGWTVEAGPCRRFPQASRRSAAELGESGGTTACPDIWELSNGDAAAIGRDLTDDYAGRLRDDVSVGAGERIVVIPRSMVVAAKPDMPDA